MIGRLIGCFTALAALGIAILTYATWPLGKIYFAMLLAMIGMASANLELYDTTEGVVIETSARDPDKIFPRNARVRYAYDGKGYVGFTRVTPLSRLNDTMEVGDTVKVWVCRSDPTAIKLVITDNADCGPIDAAAP